MADPRLKVLENLAAKAGAANSDELGTFDKLLQYADTPGRMTRAGIGALQDGTDPLFAIKGQVGLPNQEAPSGFDIASKLGEQYDIENPYALAAIATGADVLDPTMLIPGSAMGKIASPAAKMVAKGSSSAKKLIGGVAPDLTKGMYKAGDFLFPAKNSAEALQIEKALKAQGKLPGTSTVVKDTRPELPADLGKIKFLDDAINKIDVTEKFPQMQSLFKAKSQLK